MLFHCHLHSGVSSPNTFPCPSCFSNNISQCPTKTRACLLARSLETEYGSIHPSPPATPLPSAPLLASRPSSLLSSMPTARTENQRSRRVWNRAKPASSFPASSTSSSSRPPPSCTSTTMPGAVAMSLHQRPQLRRANTAPAATTTTLDADDLAKRLSMVLAQERQRQSEMERKRQSWEADLIAARREQQRRPPRQHQPPTITSSVHQQQQQKLVRPTILTAADFQDQPLPSLDEDSPLETVPPRPPVPFILNSSGYVPVYAITSSIKLNNTALRRSSSADHGRSLRRDAALDLETIDENHSSADDDSNNNNKEPTAESWQVDNKSKQRERSPAGLARSTKHRNATSPSEEGNGRARLQKLPTGARRPSQLGYTPEWLQVEDAHTDDKPTAPLSLTLVRRGSERTPNYTWSPPVDTMCSDKPGRRRSIREKVELYCTVRPRQYPNSPSTSSSSDSGRDDVHSNYSSQSWRSSLKGSTSGSRRSSILKFWVIDKQPPPPTGERNIAGSEHTFADSEDLSVMNPRARKRASLLSVFHL